MRRSIISGVSAAFLALGLAPGSATAQTAVVDGDHFGASKLVIVSQGCNDPGLVSPAPHARISRTPGPAPLGHAFVGWTPTAVGYGTGPLAFVSSPTAVRSYSIHVSSPNAQAASVAAVRYVEPGRSGVWKGNALLPEDTVSGWHTVTVPGDTAYQWRHYDVSGQLDEAATDSMTLRNFVNDRGGNNEGARVGILYGCDGDPFYVDALRVVGLTSKTYDFEGYRTRMTLGGSGTRHSMTITAGEKVRLAAVLQRASGSRTSGRIQLDVRHLTDKKYQKYASQKVHDGGKLTTTARPTRSVIFRASYPGTRTVAPSSATLIVKVRTNVTAQLVKKRIVAGTMVELRGRVAPARRATVSVQRFVNGKWHTVREARTRKDGAYAIGTRWKQAGESYWRVHASGGGGNLAGNSTWRTLTTVRHQQGGGGDVPTHPTPPPPVEPTPPPPPSGPL